jgi:dipeptidase D
MDWLNTIPPESYELHEWRGGKAHNIIPRDAFALVNVTNIKVAEDALAQVTKRWKAFMPESDRNFFGKIELLESPFEEVVSKHATRSLMDFLIAFPHGAHAYDLASHKELVALSNNLAISLLVRGQFYLQSSLRFFDRGECVGLENQVRALAQGFGMEFSKNGEYPSWKPIRENKLLELVSEKYQKLFEKKAKVTAIHAGLECGILRDKIGPIDAVSFGPTIMGAHSPQERLLVSTVEPFWNLLKEVLKSL